MEVSCFNEYFMRNETEFKRLSDKVDPNEFVQNYIASLINTDSPSEIIDIGCGSAVIAKAISHSFQNSYVTAIDNSDRHVDKIECLLSETPNCNFKLADAYQLPYRDNTFDLAFARFVFEYLKEPSIAMSEMFRVCKPGGKVMVQDLDIQLATHYPEEPILQEQLSQILTYLKNKTGFDACVGRKLYSLAYLAGLTNIKVKVAPYHLFPGKIDDKNLTLWDLKLDNALPQIAKVLGSDAAAANFKNLYLGYLQREDTFSYSVVITVVGQKPL